MTDRKKTTTKRRPAQNAPDLASLIVAVRTHPDCPDAINEGTSGLFNRLNEGSRRVYMTEPYVRALLTEHEAQKGSKKWRTVKSLT